MTTTSEAIQPGPVVLDTPSQIDNFRLATLIQTIDIHLKTNGKFRLARSVTPARMRELASQYTGKEYKRSMKSLGQALEDLRALKAERFGT